MENKEKIGYHKGCLETLIKERSELVRLVTIVESLIKLHTKALKDEGIDIAEELKKLKEKTTGEEVDEETKKHFTDVKKMLREQKDS